MREGWMGFALAPRAGTGRPVARARAPGEVAAMRLSLRQSPVRILFLAFAAALLAGPAALAGASAKPGLPRFASLAAEKVYLRQGPAYESRILWIYRRKRLPVKILASYDVWRRVEMPDGAIGWVHSAMLSGTRTVVVTGAGKVPIRRDTDPASKILALAERGVIAKLEACQASACEIDADGTEGWIDKKNIWGGR